MNTPTIASALPNSPVPAPARADAAPGGNEPDAASFSQILGRQHAAQGQQQGQQARSTAPDAGHANTNTKADRRGDTEKKGEEAANDTELATLAGEQGLSLPQIALDLAAHAMPKAGKAATKGGGPDTGPSTTLPEMATARTTLASLETGAAVGASADNATDAASGAHDLPAAGLKSAALLSGAGNAATDTARSTPAILTDVKPEAKLDDKPASTGADKPDDKDASGANAPAARGTAQSARAQASTAASTIAAAQAGAVAATPLHGTAPQQQNTSTPAATTVVAVNDMAGLTAASAAAQAATQTQPAGTALPSGSLAISTPLQQPQWPADFGRQMVTLAQTAHNRIQTAELRLDPPDLGPLRITININDNVAQAVFVSAHASVRHAVESALPQLQQQLAQAGISLGQTSVNDQGQQQTPFEHLFQSGGKQHAVTQTGASEPAMDSSVALVGARTLQNPNAIVDTFA